MKKILIFCLIATFTILGCKQKESQQKVIPLPEQIEKSQDKTIKPQEQIINISYEIMAQQMEIIKKARELKIINLERFKNCRENTNYDLEICLPYAEAIDIIDEKIDQLCFINEIFSDNPQKIEQLSQHTERLTDIYIQISNAFQNVLDTKGSEIAQKKIKELTKKEREISDTMMKSMRENMPKLYQSLRDQEVNRKINICKTYYSSLSDPNNNDIYNLVK